MFGEKCNNITPSNCIAARRTDALRDSDAQTLCRVSEPPANEKPCASTVTHTCEMHNLYDLYASSLQHLSPTDSRWLWDARTATTVSRWCCETVGTCRMCLMPYRTYENNRRLHVKEWLYRHMAVSYKGRGQFQVS